MLNEEQNNTVLTEIGTGENLVSPEVEENTEKISTEKTDIAVEENVEENINSENSSAPENLSSSFSKTDNLTEKEELEIEVENTILPNIYNGIISEDYADKLIRLGDLYAKNKENEEAPLYLRYYHFMIARYVLEKMYDESKAESTLSALNTFSRKYEIAKEEYNKVRDNSIKKNIMLVMDFIDASENRINITSDNVIEIISLDENEDGNSRQDSDLFFFPESDFYGTINSIELKFIDSPRIEECFYSNTGNYADSVEINDDRINLIRNHSGKSECIISGNLRGITVTIFGKVSQYIKQGCDNNTNNSENSTIEPQKDTTSDIFNDWDIFKAYLNYGKIKKEADWVLIYVLYSIIRYNDNTISIFRIRSLYKESHRFTDSRMVKLTGILKNCNDAGYISYKYPYISMTEEGARYVNEQYLTLSEDDIDYHINRHRAYLSDNPVKVCDHPTYKTWTEFQEIINTSTHLTSKAWYLLYMYYLTQRYSANSVTSDEIALIFRNDSRFIGAKSGSVSSRLVSCLPDILTSPDEKEYSFTEKGKGYIKSLLKGEILSKYDNFAININENVAEDKRPIFDDNVNNPLANWAGFTDIIDSERLTSENDWALACLFYLYYKYDDNWISFFRLMMMYKKINRYSSNRRNYVLRKLKEMNTLGYIQYHKTYISITESGKQYVFKRCLKISESEFLEYAEKYRLNILNNSVRVTSHPVLKTWKEFVNNIDLTNDISYVQWRFLYAYYLMQKYNDKVITSGEAELLLAEEGGSKFKNNRGCYYLKECLLKQLIEPDDNEFSLTLKGRNFIKSCMLTYEEEGNLSKPNNKNTDERQFIFMDKQVSTDIFENWNSFKPYLYLESVQWESHWILVYIFYLCNKYDEKQISVFKVQKLYDESNRTEARSYLSSGIKSNVKQGLVRYDNYLLSLTEKGEAEIMRAYSALNEKDLKIYRNYHQRVISKNSLKVCDHQVYKTWAEFTKMVTLKHRVTMPEWYLLYAYYLMLRFNSNTITNKEVGLIYVYDENFAARKISYATPNLQKCFEYDWIAPDCKEFSITERGKEHIKSLLTNKIL